MSDTSSDRSAHRIAAFAARERDPSPINLTLPEEMVRRELAILPHLGVDFVFGSRIGSDRTLIDLEHEYDAVILAGVHRFRLLHQRNKSLLLCVLVIQVYLNRAELF